MERIGKAVQAADLFVAIGTSGHVYPAAGFADLARFAGAQTVEINNAQTAISSTFERHLTGPATREVPRWVAELLG
jgi:NAD-dependent deacetylase